MRVFGILLVILSVALLTVISIQSEAYGGLTEWKSEYVTGILEPEPSDYGLNLKVTTHDKTSLKIEWEKSHKLTKVIGYKLMRKTMDSEYKQIAQLGSRQTSYLDRNLQDGYYGYKIIPIIDDKSDKTTKHGITRTNSMFSLYLLGQELLAKERLHTICDECFSKPFEEINNIFSYTFPEREENDSILQNKIANEITKADHFFKSNYDIRLKH